jgi:putative ABC transport system ATP-binding protein
LTGRAAGSALKADAGNIKAHAIVTSATASRFTREGFVPYERDGRIARSAGIDGAAPDAGNNLGRRWTDRMNDTSRTVTSRAQTLHALEDDGSAIALRNVNLSLGRGAARVHILKDVSLNIGRGQAVGLIGPSGSGKSTLLMVMAGLERPDAGSVDVAGHDLVALDEDALARFRGREVGIVFQSFHLIPTMTAMENVAVPLELAGHADAFERAERELASVGLADRLSHYPAQLSGGEQQRVALARALAPHPSILVADEPTGNLDEDTGRQIVDLLFAGHAERNTTLVLVTHDPSLAARCDRVVRMRSGHVEMAAPDRVAS